MDYSGLIFFDVETDCLNYLENASAKVAKILDLAWTNDLRHQVARITIEEQPRKVKLFSRVCKTTNSEGIKALVGKLNEDLKRKWLHDDDIFARDASYNDLVKENPIDVNIDVNIDDPKEIVDLKNFVSQDELNMAMGLLRSEFQEEMRNLYDAIKLELMEEVRKIREETKEPPLFFLRFRRGL